MQTISMRTKSYFGFLTLTELLFAGAPAFGGVRRENGRQRDLIAVDFTSRTGIDLHGVYHFDRHRSESEVFSAGDKSIHL